MEFKSILMAMKVYRDQARKEKNITEPELIMPISAHPAFVKSVPDVEDRSSILASLFFYGFTGSRS